MKKLADKQAKPATGRRSMMHDLGIAVAFLAMVCAPCMAAMSTGVHTAAELETEEPSEFA